MTFSVGEFLKGFIKGFMSVRNAKKKSFSIKEYKIYIHIFRG